MDLTGAIIDYESGNLSNFDTILLFSALVKNGMAWTLQGHYGRVARCLIENEILTKNGDILHFPGENNEK